MKYIFTVLILFSCLNINAQITVNASDMPNVGDTIRKSITTVGQGYDFSLTGNDFIWDYANLSSLSQDVDSFISVGSTSLIYQIAFNNPFDPNRRATIALPTDDITLIPGVPLTDIIDFYKESNSKYSRVGMGITIAGIPFALKYDTPELLYNFPLTIGDIDSTVSSFDLSIPTLGFLTTTKKRVNEVDGWGTLTTPFGTHQVIRVKSTITENDSVYVDSLGIGLPVTRNITEYAWLGDNFGIPLLQVVQEGLVTTIRYIDNFNVPPFDINLGFPQLICEGEQGVIKADVSGGCPPYSFLWSTGSTVDSIIVSPPSTAIYSLTVSDACNDTLTANAVIIVSPAPNVDLGNDTTINTGDTLVLNAGAGMMNSYLWSDGSTAQSITVDTAGVYWVEVTNIAGCSASDTIFVTFSSGGTTITGTVTYDNSVSTKLAGVKVFLLDSSSHVVDSAFSDVGGGYEFFNVANGSYMLETAYSYPWGGVNSTDALAIMQHFTGIYNLTGLRLEAADVDISNYINSVDALYVAQRFVLLINSFPAGDWVFEKPTVTVNGSPVVMDIKGLCVGDVDGSYVP